MSVHLLRTRILFPLLAVLALGAMLTAAACGGDDDDDAGSGSQAEFKLGDLTVIDPWVRAAPATDVTAAYLTIKSSGAADTLVSVSSPIAGMVQLHEVVTEGSTSKMQEKPGGFPVPANGSVELKPGGYHIMLMNLKQRPKEGETVELTLKFEKAGELKIAAPVKAASGSSPDMSHDGHGSSDMQGGGMATPGMGR
ncbi:copper chaperone PCu(A)C [Tepidiforma sp.]|uniref:copper chaperone PCu(A)C n=1 Tax=Tepidiforma sp. TaxID=2682230 RepID=UPI002ADDD5B8|nr:copper chaperone PCu(A)C [Tepidiforma sp.]